MRALVDASSCSDRSSPATRIAVLGAFPAELAPNVQKAIISDKVVIEGRTFRLGTLAGVPVVLDYTISARNASAATTAFLELLAAGW